MAFGPLPQKVTKIEAGKRRLATAIWMFFLNGDAVAVHSLACAAREIFERMLKARGQQRSLDRILISQPELKENDLTRELNEFRNFFKHADDGANSMTNFSDAANDTVLSIACCDLAELERAMSVEAQVFQIWYSAAHPGSTDEPAVVELLPGLHLLPRHEQKAKGRDLLSWAKAEPALLMDSMPLAPLASSVPSKG